MKLKKSIILKSVALLCSFMMAGPGVVPAYAVAPDSAVCATGVASPPFLGTTVSSNVMIVIDNSASMYDLAFVEDASLCYEGIDAASGAETYDPVNNEYSGFFEPDQWYAYNTDPTENRFVATVMTDTDCAAMTYHKQVSGEYEVCLEPDAASPANTVFVAKGQFLNWAAASKMDFEKKILTGGKYESGNLVMESRGCLERRFVREVSLDDNAGTLTLAVRMPTADENPSGTDNMTRIELFPVTADGFSGNLSDCQAAVENMASGDNLGQLKDQVDGCMGYDNTVTNFEADSNSAFNTSLQSCWTIAKHGEFAFKQTFSASNEYNACDKLYSDHSVMPWEIVPADTAYVCSGSPVGEPYHYIGYCWDAGTGGTAPTVLTCNSGTLPAGYTADDGYHCNADDEVEACSGSYNKNQGTCGGNPGEWVAVYTGGTPGTDPGWNVVGSYDFDGDGNLTPDDCVGEALFNFCGAVNSPEVVDPSGQVTGTGDETSESWNLPAMMVDSGVEITVGEPLLVMSGRLQVEDNDGSGTVDADDVTGLIHEAAADLRMGVMTFNKDGSKSECETVDSYVDRDCEDPTLDIRDGANVKVPIGQSASHTTALANAINEIVADTWTPLGEAIYNAIGYYRQEDPTATTGFKGLNPAASPTDYLTTTNPITEYCQMNNILLLTDGAPTVDQASAMTDYISGTVPTALHTVDSETYPAADSYTPAGVDCANLSGGTYLKDLTKFAYEALWHDKTCMTGEDCSNISTHIVAAGSFSDTGTDECLPFNLLTDAATNGGTTLYQAEDLSQLETKLRDAFNSMRAAASAGSAASVISASRGGEGAIYQAIFWPAKSSTTDPDVKAKWIGEVHSLFIDSSGSMYEDSNNDGALDATDKRVYLYFDESDDKQTTMACYDEPENNSCDAPVTLDEVHYLWSANDWLAKISNSAFTTPAYDADDQYLNRSTYISNERRRYIFTWNDLDNDAIVDDAEVLPFVSGNNSAGSGTPVDWAGLTVDSTSRGAVPFDFNVGNDANANSNVGDIVDWIRGVEVSGLRSRTLNKPMINVSPDPEVVWRLGDVIHSTPTTVARPMENLHLLYQDGSYTDFVRRWANRRHVVYFGANDGMMHAVNGGFYDDESDKFCLDAACSESPTNVPDLGAELWAYVPYNLQPHLKCLTDPNYADSHKYDVDQPPRIFGARRRLATRTQRHICRRPQRLPVVTTPVAGER